MSTCTLPLDEASRSSNLTIGRTIHIDIYDGCEGLPYDETIIDRKELRELYRVSFYGYH